jgi:hypothetical protein
VGWYFYGVERLQPRQRNLPNIDNFNSNCYLGDTMRIVRMFASVAVLTVAALSHARDMPIVDPAEITAKYGKPDLIKSTEHDKPRPPFVTRMLEYKKEHVRFAFLANAPIGSPPPYTSWRLLGYQDPRDNKVIPADEMERRMLSRKKK